MIARKLAWLAVEGSLLWLFAAFGSSLCLALAAGLLLIPLVSVPVHLSIRNRLRLELSADGSLQKEAQGALTVRLTNPTIFSPAVRCRLSLRNLLNGAAQRLSIECNAPKGTQELAVELGSSHCGRLRVSVEKLKLYDCFGLIGIPVKCDAKCHVTVQPRGFACDVMLNELLGGAEDSDLYSQLRPGWDLTETFQLRVYVPGDSPRQIHWKLSGKFDRLIVRDPGLPVVRSVLLFWERSGESGDKAVIDAQAEALFSIASALLEQSVQFRLGWNDAAENRCVILEIADLDDLIGALPRVLSAAGSPDGDSGAGMLLQSRPDALCSHMVYLANSPAPEVLEWQRHGHVTVLTCADPAPEGAVRFDENNYPAQLSMLEL